MLGTVTVKPENPQVGVQSKNLYRLYRLRRLTQKLTSPRRYTGHTVQAVQKLIRFDKPVWEVA